MKASEAITISDNAKSEYIAKNISAMTDRIDARIRKEASRSGKYPITSCNITINKEFDIAGVLEGAVKEHYIENGFGFTTNSSQSSHWMTITWEK